MSVISWDYIMTNLSCEEMRNLAANWIKGKKKNSNMYEKPVPIVNLLKGGDY